MLTTQRTAILDDKIGNIHRNRSKRRKTLRVRDRDQRSNMQTSNRSVCVIRSNSSMASNDRPKVVDEFCKSSGIDGGVFNKCERLFIARNPMQQRFSSLAKPPSSIHPRRAEMPHDRRIRNQLCQSIHLGFNLFARVSKVLDIHHRTQFAGLWCWHHVYILAIHRIFLRHLDDNVVHQFHSAWTS